MIRSAVLVLEISQPSECHIQKALDVVCAFFVCDPIVAENNKYVNPIGTILDGELQSREQKNLFLPCGLRQNLEIVAIKLVMVRDDCDADACLLKGSDIFRHEIIRVTGI